MTAMEWLLIVALGALALWVVAGVIDACTARRPLPPIPQPVRHAPPPLPSPPSWGRVDMARVRAARTAGGRHRRPEGPQ